MLDSDADSAAAGPAWFWSEYCPPGCPAAGLEVQVFIPLPLPVASVSLRGGGSWWLRPTLKS